MKEKKEKILFGTEEWCTKTTNYISGCEHDCKYCYAKEMSIRFKRKTTDNWVDEVVNYNALNKKFRKIEGRIMFPSTHDISPSNLNHSIRFLHNILETGNEVLIVSKPHLDVIKVLCDEFKDFKSQILFRFTIGSTDNKTLRFWEPNAPDYDERKESVIHAFNHGYQTSLSCEPMLDDNIECVVTDLEDYITETIWIGKMNSLLKRLKVNGSMDRITVQKGNELIALQSDTNIIKLYDELKDNPKIKWKESIVKVLKKNGLGD